MSFMLAQFGTDLVSTIIWIILAIIFFLFGPRLMVTQTIIKIEKEVAELEDMAEKSKNYVIHSISKKPSPTLKRSVKGFMEFFAVGPVSIDPYGVIKKLDHIIKNSDEKFNYFTRQIAPGFSKEKRKNIKNALQGAITTHQIAKIVRHYLELIKKYKMFQLAMVIQMQIPLISRIAKAAMRATQAFSEGIPIGDSIGPLVAANLIKRDKVKIFEEDEFIVAKSKIDGKDVWVSKAEGPGASTGYPGKFLKKFFKKQKIDRIITIDAALRLEGEKTGIIAEGVGVAMGGSGVDRYEIEEIAVKKNIPLDAVAVKVSQEEALEPMKKEIFDAVPNAIENIKDILNRRKKKERVLILGVGNTCGIGNSIEDLKGLEKKLKSYIKKMEEKKKKRAS
ncbi:MAG: DUF1512 domain-containing protein [Candidatus Aenigmarchaeota archaeon]|nr:DUF1512 domain-containing protein [Candidatus Aenigmarchaeota archaeon]